MKVRAIIQHIRNLSQSHGKGISFHAILLRTTKNTKDHEAFFLEYFLRVSLCLFVVNVSNICV